MMIKSAAVAIAGCALFAASASAQNGDIVVQGQPVAYVSYEDLNLRSAAGVDTLNRRVSRAAERICGVNGNRETLAIELNGRACMKTALESAQPQIESAIGASE